MELRYGVCAHLIAGLLEWGQYILNQKQPSSEYQGFACLLRDRCCVALAAYKVLQREGSASYSSARCHIYFFRKKKLD